MSGKITDRMRLDWLSKRLSLVGHIFERQEYIYRTFFRHRRAGDSLRQAIDAALRSERKKPTPRTREGTK